MNADLPQLELLNTPGKGDGTLSSSLGRTPPAVVPENARPYVGHSEETEASNSNDSNGDQEHTDEEQDTSGSAVNAMAAGMGGFGFTQILDEITGLAASIVVGIVVGFGWWLLRGKDRLFSHRVSGLVVECSDGPVMAQYRSDFQYEQQRFQSAGNRKNTATSHSQAPTESAASEPNPETSG